MATPPSPLSTAERRARLYSLLGDLPDRNLPVSARKRDEQARDGDVLESWELDLTGLEPVPALLARPLAPARVAVLAFLRDWLGERG